MTKINRSLIGRQIRGALGPDLNFRRRGKTQIAQNKPIPANPRTPAQTAHRSIFQGGIETWLTLTPAEKAWFAALNPKIGYNPGYLNFMALWLAGTVPDHHEDHEAGGTGEISAEDLLGTTAALAAHQALLDAHTRDIFQTIRTGAAAYHLPPTITSYTAVGNEALPAGRIYAYALPVVRPFTLDRLALTITGAAAAGQKARLGIYNAGANLYPGDLLLDAGEVAIDAITVVAAIIDETLPKALYWLAFNLEGQIGCPKFNHHLRLIGHAADPRFGYAAWSVAEAYGPLADPYPAGAVRQTHVHCIGFRLSSLD